MTPERFRKIRRDNGLTQSQLAAALRVSDLRTIRRWEKGDAQISGPVSLLMEAMEKAHWMNVRGGWWSWHDEPYGVTKGDRNA